MPPPSRAIDESKAKRQSSNLTFPEDLGENGLILVFRNYSYQAPGEGGLLRLAGNTVENIGDTLSLPIPLNLVDTYSMRILRPEGGAIAEAIAGAAASSRFNASTDISGVVTNMQGSMMGMMMSADDMKEMLHGNFSNLSSNARYLTQMLWKDNAWGGAIDRGHGTVINPKASLTFEGIEMKVHNFEWNFMPRSPNESTTLKDIIHVLKRNMLPAYMNAGGIQKALMKYPSVVDVYFVGIDPDYFFRFKTCMVQNVTVTYSDADSLGILEGGRPASVMLGIQLAETDVHASADYGGEGATDAIINLEPPEYRNAGGENR